MGLQAGIIQGLSSVGSAYAQSEAARAQGNYQREMSEINAKYAEGNANDAIKRGEEAANAHRKQTNQLRGSQVAKLAAQGLDVGSGSAAELISQTEEYGQLDELSIKNNAWREAWGFRAEAANTRSQGRFAQIAGNGEARQTLIAGGMRGMGDVMGGYARSGTRVSQEEDYSGNAKGNEGRAYGNRRITSQGY